MNNLKFLFLSITLLFAPQALCMEQNFNEGKKEECGEDKQNQTPFGTLSILPKDVISYIISQIIEKYEDPVEAYEAFKSFKLNGKFYDLIIDVLFSKFKYKYPSKLHIAAKINAINWISKNVNFHNKEINLPDSNGYTPLALAMFNVNKEILKLLLMYGANLGNITADIDDPNPTRPNFQSSIGLYQLILPHLDEVVGLISGEIKMRSVLDAKLLIWAIKMNHIKFAAYLIVNSICPILKIELIVNQLNEKEEDIRNILRRLKSKLDVIQENENLEKLPIKLVYDNLTELLKTLK